MHKRIKVAVLRGGPSSEYDISLATGKEVLSHLRAKPAQYEPLDIFISKEGEWHVDGVVREPHVALRMADVAYNALHGEYGEDGEVQRVLEEVGVPYTGSRAMPSALAYDKHRAKKLLRQAGLRTPRHEHVTTGLDSETLHHIFHNYTYPVVLKPAKGGSSLKVKLVHAYMDLAVAVTEALLESAEVMIEEFIRGKEATCGVVQDFRGHELYALVPLEVRREEGKRLHDYESKYTKPALHMAGMFDTQTTRQIEEYTKLAHETLGLEHYSRSDFIITSQGKVYILETNSHPSLTPTCPMTQALHETGLHPKEFVSHCVELALRR